MRLTCVASEALALLMSLAEICCCSSFLRCSLYLVILSVRSWSLPPATGALSLMAITDGGRSPLLGHDNQRKPRLRRLRRTTRTGSATKKIYCSINLLIFLHIYFQPSLLLYLDIGSLVSSIY